MKFIRVNFTSSTNKWFLLSGTFLILSFWVYYGLFFRLINTMVCPVRTITGVPCLTCGGTGMVQNAMHGNFLNALSMNPLLFLTAATALVFYVITIVLTLFNMNLKVEFTNKELFFLRSLIVILAVVNWIYLIWTY